MQIIGGCRHCKNKNVIRWGRYWRNSCKTISGDQRIPIQRFRCKGCLRTFSYLPPFLIRYKHYDLAVLAPSLQQLFEKGKSYLKATADGLDVSTVFRYAKYYLEKSDLIIETMKQRLLSWAPGYTYEKDPRLALDQIQNRRNTLRQSLVISETLIRMVFLDRLICNNSLSMINFTLWLKSQQI